MKNAYSYFPRGSYRDLLQSFGHARSSGFERFFVYQARHGRQPAALIQIKEAEIALRSKYHRDRYDFAAQKLALPSQKMARTSSPGAPVV